MVSKNRQTIFGQAIKKTTATLAERGLLPFSNVFMSNKPIYILGCQRSGTTMLLEVLRRCPEMKVYHEGHRLAFKGEYRFRSVNKIKSLIITSDKQYLVFKPLNDIQHIRKYLAINKNSIIIWIYRHYADVVNSAVVKWGSSQKEIISSICKGINNYTDQNAIQEKMNPETLALIKTLYYENMSDQDGAALLWYVRNSIYFDIGLHKSNNLLLRYEDLVRNPIDHFSTIFQFLNCPFDKSYVEMIYATSVRKSAAPKLNCSIEAVCVEMLDKMNTHYQQTRFHSISM